MSENQDDFKSLRRLLSLKRHETPPPGYFNNFSGLVLQRIRSEQAKASAGLSGELFSQAPWLSKLVQVLNMKPAFAGGFAGALCMVLFFGIIYAERPDMTPEPLLHGQETTSASLASLSPSALSQPSSSIGIVSSTNPVFSLQPVASNFGPPSPLAQPVSFSFPGN